MLEATTPALSAAGVSVSQEQAGVRCVLYHAELIRISHISGYIGHKKEKEKKRRGRREFRKNYARQWTRPEDRSVMQRYQP